MNQLLSFRSRSEEDLEPEADQSEQQLVQRMLEGDREAFDTFVHRYSPGLFRYARAHLTEDPDSAPDLVQMTMVTAMERLADYRGEGPIGAWLMGICRYQIAAFRRRAATRSRFSGGPVEDFDLFEDREASVEDRLDMKQKKEQIHSTLELLPPPYGDVLRWKYLLDEPVRRIAERLGVSSKAAESLLTRARKAFGKVFDQTALGEA